MDEHYLLTATLSYSEYSEDSEDSVDTTSYENDTDSPVNVEQEIVKIIGKEIGEKRSLKAVILKITYRFRSVISTTDERIITQHYISICGESWKNEVCDYLKEIERSKNTSVINNVLGAFESSESLFNVHEPLKKGIYYNLLIDHYEAISKENEESLMWWYKNECYQYFKNSNEALKFELELLEALLDFLHSFKSINSTYLLRYLNEFCIGKISVSELIAKIGSMKDQYSEKRFRSLHTVASRLDCNQNLYLKNEFNNALSSYLKPVKLSEKAIDARSIIEITGTYIVISECFKNVEQILQAAEAKGSEVHEVHFVGTLVVHIDTDLNNEIWHGRNIVVCTRMVIVHGSVTWDVSGKNADHIYTTNAGTNDEGDGIRGRDGYPGESGGNVLFVTDKIENSTSLKIISKGGNGSNGQDGGDGRDGRNGTGVSRNSIEERFPPPCRFQGKEHSLLVKKILTNIQSAATSVKTAWINGSTMSMDALLRNYKNQKTVMAEIFIEGKTEEGNEIVFSSDCGVLARQSFFLYKGTNGTPGRIGGSYGLGGQGGFAGAIVMEPLSNCKNPLVIQTEAVAGTDGNTGKKGINGKHGKNGWDMGYLNYWTWSEVKYYGTSENEKLKLVRSGDSTSSNVWSAYCDRYVGIEAIKIEHSKQSTYEQSTSSTCATERQHHATAVNKKTVSKQSILGQYSQQMNNLMENAIANDSKIHQHLRNVDSMVTTIGQTLAKQIQNKLQKRKIFKISRQCKYFETSEHSIDDSDDELLYSSRQERIEIDRLVANLTDCQPAMHYWFQLTSIQLGSLELNLLHEKTRLPLHAIKKSQVSGKKIENIEPWKIIQSIIDEKYRLVALNKIAEIVQTYLNITGDIKIQAESAAKYLLIGRNMVSFSDDLTQYLGNEDSGLRKKVFQYCTDIVKRKDATLWSLLVRTFFIELNNPSEKVMHLHAKYHFYAQNCSQGLIVFRASLEKLENQCRDDLHLMKEVKKFLLEKGPLSKTYRLLLANMLDVNIRTYIKDDDDKFSLSDDNNAASNNVIYLLLTDDGLHELCINKARLEMEVERRLKSQLCFKILAEIEPLRGKQEFNDYFLKLAEFIEKINGLTSDDLSEVGISKRSAESSGNRKCDKVIQNLPLKCASFEDLSIENFNFHSKTSLSCPDILKACEYTGLYLDQMEDLNDIMKYFDDDREKQEMTKKFNKISQYIGYPEIVHNIQRRFACEGRHVSYEELSCMINSVLSTFNDREEHLNIVSWIVAAYSQQNWIDELVLMKIEDYLKIQIKDKKEWRAYLSKIENKKLLVLLHEKLDSLNLGSSVTYQCFADIFYLLSKIAHEPLRLTSLELSEWPYALREKYWIFMLSTLIGSEADQSTSLLYYLLSIENTYGTKLTEQVVQSLQEVRKYESLSPRQLEKVFCNFHDEKWILNAHVIESFNGSRLDSWIDSMEMRFTADGKERSMKQLIELIENNGNTSRNIMDALPIMSDFISNALKAQRIREMFLEETITTKDDIKKCAKSIRDAIRDKNLSARDSLGKILNVIDKAIELELGFALRDTQKLAILSLTINPRNTLAQVSTGEGKSLIVVATAIIKALQGKKVHIVTSSPVLAKRDAEDNAKIFNLFDVYASHNCNEDIEKRKEAYSNNQVIYGDLSNFQRDYLLDRFYGKRVLGDHDLENVIIDEVDSMLLDKGNNMLYLSHNLSGFDKLEPVYIFIWQWINRPATNSKELSAALDTSAIKEAILDEIYVRILKADIDELHVQLKQQEKLTIWARMIDANIIDERGNILKETITEKDIDGIISPEQDYAHSVRNRLRYILNECTDRVRSIVIPIYLKSFVEQHLESWIRSAVTAFFMKTGEDYVVDLDNTDTSQDRNPNIIIIDRDTGTDMANSQWDEALYQFLQLKHGCKLSLQNLKAVFISNVSYFKKYKTLNGLTGTLGTKRDRDLLQEIHDVDYVIIPTAASKLFHEEKSIVCTTKDDWKNQILLETKQITNEQKRSVLIICETVNVVNDLYELFGGRKETHVHTYTRDYEQFEVAKDGHKLNPGQIVIATNLAGRGTDIKISDDLNQAGGLHVLLTYLPKNIRIEQQAFGRAARSGAKGSGRLIILNSNRQDSACATKMLELKRNRHTQDLNRLAECKLFYDVQITAEEECFEKFNAEYERLKKELTEVQIPNKLQDFLLECCLDNWAYWLDKNSKWISTSHNSLGKTKYQTTLKAFIGQMKNLSTGATEGSILDKVNPNKLLKKYKYDSKYWIEWVNGNPPQMVKLGKYLSQNLKEFANTHDAALELFDGVIRGDSNFSEVARYYKASLLMKQIENGGESIINSVKTELRLAAKLFERRIEQHSKAASIIGNIKSNNTESLIQINAFEDQQRHFMELYNEFITSVNNILGHPVSSECFISQIPSINKQLANAIFAELHQHMVLKAPKLGNEYSEKELKVICDEYGVPVSLLQTIIKAWEVKRFDEQEFRKHLEQRISIPNRHQFWTMLLEKKVLCENKQYVAIQKGVLEGIDNDLIKSLKEKVKKEHKEDILNLGDGNQIVYADWTELQKANELIFEIEYFRAIVGQMKYEELNKLEALSFNEKANVNRNVIENVHFEAFDSIRPNEFANVGIVLSEAEDIIAELVKQNVLVRDSETKNNVYRLKGSLSEISDEKFTFFAGYKQIVQQLLSGSFSYRIAFDNILKCLQEGISQTELGLVVNPHRNLMVDLYEKHILIPPSVDSSEKDLDKVVEKIFKNSSNTCLNNSENIKHVTNILSNLSSSLKWLEMPDGALKPLPEASGLTEEQQIFELNGLDGLLQCEEKKWSNKMLFNTLCLSCIAVGQISFGIVTSPLVVGSSFVAEGVNDFIFAIRAMQTGYFSWTNYWNQKWKSILVTVCTAGIFYAAKHCFKFLRYGMKAYKTLSFGKVSSVLQGQLTKIAAQKEIASMTKRVIVDAASRIAMAVGNSAIENIVQTYLHSLCKEIGSSIASDIDKAVECHSIAGTLRQAFYTLGEAQARQTINNCTLRSFNENSDDNVFKSTIVDISIGLKGKCMEALGKTLADKNINNNPAKIISTCSTLLTWGDRVYHLSKIKSETNVVLDDLDKNIKQILESQTNMPKSAAEKRSSSKYETFKKEIIDQWKASFNERVGKVVESQLVTPLLQSAATYLTQSTLKLLKYTKNRIRGHKERKYRKRFEKLKRKYKKQKKGIRLSEDKKIRKTMRAKIRKRYHKSLLKLMTKTRSPDLMADLVKENVPMDYTCVAALPVLLSRITMERNIKIVIEGPDGKDHQFSSDTQSSTDTKIIRLKLKDNHFTLCEESMNRIGDFDGSNNSCLYVAMMQAMPEMDMSQTDFRNAVANCIRTDPAIRRSIEKGYHHKLLAKGFYGGRAPEKESKQETEKGERQDKTKKKGRIDQKDSIKKRIKAVGRKITNVIFRDVDSTEYADGEVHDGDDHFVCRFKQTLCAKGVIDSAYSEYSDLDYVVTGGGSKGQDRTSGKGSEGIDAAHLLRVGGINPKLINTDHGIILKNMSYKTQNVNQCFNRRKVAKDIDSLQSQFLMNSPPIIVNGVFNCSANQLKKFKKDYMTILKAGMKSDPTNAQVYKNSISQIKRVSLTQIKRDVRDAYNFVGKVENYMPNFSKPIKSKIVKSIAKPTEKRRPENEE
ncbi:uncharacterized protein LOC118466796 [Anopheles albimanus]|uniref:uncharacterized protein LOC118466796 n=1 Tax=Anopheles albimanus TaxID=7167 RepID=UPI00164070E8|nr:uncharacterized protein LOC118466796 [Anopheles albimanus]